MTSALLKFEAITLLLAFLVIDWWFTSFRCSVSPDIDWPRLGFGIFVQILIVGGLLLLSRIHADPNAKTLLTIAGVALILGIVSFPMVRDSALFGDTVDAERTSNSKGLLCPGALSVFPLGHR